MTVKSDKKILIVDDLEDLRWLTSETLRRAGFDTVEASDGLEALELLRYAEHPGLIMLDWNMPRMDGKEFLLELRSDPKLAAIPVVLMSAEIDLEKIAADAAVEGFVGKTSEVVKILEVVRKALKNS